MRNDPRRTWTCPASAGGVGPEIAATTGGFAGLAEVGERSCLDRGLGNAGVGETYAELLAALRIVPPAQRSLLPVGAELSRVGRLDHPDQLVFGMMKAAVTVSTRQETSC